MAAAKPLQKTTPLGKENDQDFTLEMATVIAIGVRETSLGRPLTTTEKDQIKAQVQASVKATEKPKARPVGYTSTVKATLIRDVSDKAASPKRDALIRYIRDGEWKQAPFPITALHKKFMEAGYTDLATKCSDGVYDSSEDDDEDRDLVLVQNTVNSKQS